MSTCQTCRHENEPDALYCDHCGEQLEPVCPGCRRANRVGAKFCRYCRTSLPQPPEPPDDAPPDPDPEPPAAEPFAEEVPVAPPLPDAARDDDAPSPAGDHRAALRAYVGFWYDPDARPDGMSAPEAAYYLLLHAGMTARYAGDPDVLAGLKTAVGDDRRRLLLDGCRYAAGLTLGRAAERLLDDALESEQVEQLIDLAVARDGAEEALRAARALADDPADRADPEVRLALARAAAAASAPDEFLRPRPDLRAAIADQLEPLRDAAGPALDPTREWWLFPPTGPDADAPEWDELLALTAPPRAAVAVAEPVAEPAVEPKGEPVPVQTAEAVDFTLAAASSGTVVTDMAFTAPDDPAVGGAVLLTREFSQTSFHFLFHAHGRMERTTAWDGGAVLADAGGRTHEQPIERGLALLRLADWPTAFRLRTPDGRVLGLRLFEE